MATRRGREIVSVVQSPSRHGVVIRNPIGATTCKSLMGVRPHRGIKQPGKQASDQKTPLF